MATLIKFLVTGVAEMLRKVIAIVFISMFSMISLNTLAASAEPTKNLKNLSTISGDFSRKVVQADVGPTDNQEVKIAQENNVKNESAGPSLWLLTVGLLGFVMLSNRSGV